MKKLMIAVAAVVMAAVTNAGTVSWTISNVYLGNSTDKATGNAYIFGFADGATGNYTASTIGQAIINAYATGADEAAGVAAVKSFLNANALGADGTAVTWTPAEEAGKYSLSTGAYNNSELGLAGGTYYTLYAVIFDDTVDNFGADTKFFVTGDKRAQTKGDAATQNASFAIGSQSTRSQAAANWTAIAPEPTSGLLMLLGMAGLALRRRRA